MRGEEKDDEQIVIRVLSRLFRSGLKVRAG
jgi:hypothetical protein